jgi:DNA polymerase-3 subunit alpha
MAEFAKYGFNKAHAFAYAVLGFWCAFLRFHYPVEFLLAALSTVDMDRIPEFIDECRYNGYGILPPDVNRSKVAFDADGTDIVYGLSMVKGIGVETAMQIERMAPYTSLEDFITRCVKFEGSKVNMGTVRTLVEVGAFDSLVGNRRAVEQQLEAEASGLMKRCVFKLEQPNLAHPHNLPCGFDWAQEKEPPMIRKRVDGKMQSVPKPPPKACTVKCRGYQAPKPIDPASVVPYSPEEIMRRERELLGVWITYSPFGGIAEDILHQYDTAQMIEAGPAGTDWAAIVLVEAVKKKTDKNGNSYAFVTVNGQDGEIEAICFASVWEKVGSMIRKDQLGGAHIRKTPGGYQIADFVEIN